ncbi:MAG: LUD domain-containing protein [Aquisalimonadaceae bacterium]
MNDAKQRILAEVRRGLGRDTPPAPDQVESARRDAYASSPAQHPVWDGDRVERFLSRFDAEAGTWQRVSGMEAVADTVARHLAAGSLGTQLRVAPHPLLSDLAWPRTLEITIGAEKGPDSNVAVSVAEMGLAETGTLVLYSGPESPTTLAFLPEFHIVVLRTGDVVDYMEDVWRRMRERGDFPPRSLNFITGPSRTADVEQTIQLGAHGPRALHLILVD